MVDMGAVTLVSVVKYKWVTGRGELSFYFEFRTVCVNQAESQRNM